MDESAISNVPSLLVTPVRPANNLISRLTGNKSAKKLFQQSENPAGENTDPNSLAKDNGELPAESAIAFRASTEEGIPETQTMEQPQQELFEEAEGEESYDDYEEQDKLRQNEHLLRERHAMEEMMEHLGLQKKTLEKALETMAKQHKKEVQLKDEESLKHKKYAQKCKEELDAKSVEFQRAQSKLESECMTKINQLKSEIKHTKDFATGAPGASFSAGKSFSMRLLSSSSSRKLQAKVQANATGRDHARQLKNLEDEVHRIRGELQRVSRENELWREAAAQSSCEKTQLMEEIDFLTRKVSKLKEIFTKLHGKYKAQKAREDDLIFKAGSVAEQLQATTAELEYERQKHVKVSRLQVQKQADELNRLKFENEALKKNTPVKDSKEAKPASAKKSASKSGHKRTEASSEPVERAPELVLTGHETIAELVALKALQREQRAVDLEKALQKNRDSKRRRDQALATSGDPNKLDIGGMLRHAFGNRRALLTEEESMLLGVPHSSDEEDEEDEQGNWD